MSTSQIKKIAEGVFELPDKTIVYSMKRALQEYKRLKPVDYSVNDLILFLLYAQDKPVRGRTVLFKEIFVLEQQIFKNENMEDCKFVPYYYGPYSFHVANKLQHLISAGLVKQEGKKNTDMEEFSLTAKGKFVIKSKYKKLPTDLQKDLEKLRMGLDQLKTNGILNFVYRYYPKYIDRSKIRYKYKLITWGKGKG